jgi:hypothetical protein
MAGHGNQFLSTTLLPLNLLVFLAYTVLQGFECLI